MLPRFAPAVRRFTTSLVRRDEHSIGGIPGENLPFDLDNRYKLTLYFTLFMGSGIGLPFLVMAHQLTK